MSCFKTVDRLRQYKVLVMTGKLDFTFGFALSIGHVLSALSLSQGVRGAHWLQLAAAEPRALGPPAWLDLTTALHACSAH
jgi:hypothetical protein